MMRDITERMTVISARISIIIAHLFHTIAVIPDVTARMIAILALISPIIRAISIMTALLIEITGALSAIIPGTWPIIRILWLIGGVLWLTKNELSDTIGQLTGPDRGSDDPPIALP